MVAFVSLFSHRGTIILTILIVHARRPLSLSSKKRVLWNGGGFEKEGRQARALARPSTPKIILGAHTTHHAHANHRDQPSQNHRDLADFGHPTSASADLEIIKKTTKRTKKTANKRKQPDNHGQTERHHHGLL